MPEEEQVAIDFSRTIKNKALYDTLSEKDVELIAGFDDTLIAERHRYQHEAHEKRKEGLEWTRAEWSAVMETFMSAGYTRKEAIQAADEGISPESELGIDLISKRSIRVEVYMEETGVSREKAIQFCADELVRHNRRRGNIDEFILSESTVI